MRPLSQRNKQLGIYTMFEYNGLNENKYFCEELPINFNKLMSLALFHLLFFPAVTS